MSHTILTHLFEFLDLSLCLQVTKFHKESHLRGKLSWFQEVQKTEQLIYIVLQWGSCQQYSMFLKIKHQYFSCAAECLHVFVYYFFKQDTFFTNKCLHHTCTILSHRHRASTSNKDGKDGKDGTILVLTVMLAFSIKPGFKPFGELDDHFIS